MRRLYKPGEVVGGFTLIRPGGTNTGGGWVCVCNGCGSVSRLHPCNVKPEGAGCRECVGRKGRAVATVKRQLEGCETCRTTDPKRFRAPSWRVCMRCEQRSARAKRAAGAVS